METLQEELDEKARINRFALLSKLAYDGPSSTRSTTISSIIGYTIDSDLSNARFTVFTKNKIVVMACKGTQFTNPSDIDADIAIINGELADNSRFVEALSIANSCKSKYKEKTMYATGHSLGGTLALYICEQIGVLAVAYNPGSSPYVNWSLPNNCLVIRNQDDVVSSFIATSENADKIISVNPYDWMLFNPLFNIFNPYLLFLYIFGYSTITTAHKKHSIQGFLTDYELYLVSTNT